MSRDEHRHVYGPDGRCTFRVVRTEGNPYGIACGHPSPKRFAECAVCRARGELLATRGGEAHEPPGFLAFNAVTPDGQAYRLRFCAKCVAKAHDEAAEVLLCLTFAVPAF